MNRPRPHIRNITGFLIGLALCLALAGFNQWREFDLWRNYALGGFLIGSSVTYAIWRYDVRVPQYIQVGVVAAAFAHFLGGSLGSPPSQGHVDGGLLGMHGINGAYHVFPWWDNLTHSLGIGAATTGYAYLFEAYQIRRGLGWRPHHVVLASVLAGLATGVVVELYEYLGKTAFQTIDQGGYANTMIDLHFNLLGALVGSGIAMTVNRTAMRETITAHWGAGPEATPGRFWARLPTGMTGFFAFVSIPAITSLIVAALFWTHDPTDPTGASYDRALNRLTLSAVLGCVAYPVVTMLHGKARPQRPTAATEAQPTEE